MRSSFLRACPDPADTYKDFLKDLGMWPPMQYKFLGEPITERQFRFLSRHLNFSNNLMPPKETILAPLSPITKQTFYVIDRNAKDGYGYHGSPYLRAGGDLFTADIDKAWQFKTGIEAVEVFNTKLDSRYERRFSKIVRVERTITPGATTPATERRTVVNGIATLPSDMWALVNSYGLFHNLDAKEGQIQFGVSIEHASLFISEPQLLDALQRAAIKAAKKDPFIETYSIGSRIVRVRVEQSPEVRAKDIVMDTLTGLE